MTLSAAGLSEGGRIFMEAQCVAGPSWLGRRGSKRGRHAKHLERTSIFGGSCTMLQKGYILLM